MYWRRKGGTAGTGRTAPAMIRGTTAPKTERSYKRAVREEGRSYGTRYREGAVQGHGRAGGVEGRPELRSAHSRGSVGVIRREGALRLRGTRNRIRVDQARRRCAQRRRERRRQWRRRPVQVLIPRSAVPRSQSVFCVRLFGTRAERTQCGRAGCGGQQGIHHLPREKAVRDLPDALVGGFED